MRNGILKVAERYRSEWPTSAALYLDNGQPVVEGTLIRNPDWARTLKGAIDASLRAASSGREAGIQAAIDYFYTGPVARAAVAGPRVEVVDGGLDTGFASTAGRAQAGVDGAL